MTYKHHIMIFENEHYILFHIFPFELIRNIENGTQT